MIGIWHQLGIFLFLYVVEYTAQEFDLNGLFEELGGKMNCPSFKCPSKKLIAPNPDYDVYADGCGSLGLHLDGLDEFTECCNWHDACYGTCGYPKAKCEKRFEKCLKKKCSEISDTEERKKCDEMGKLFVIGVQVMGCKSYEEAQKDSCICVLNKFEKNNKIKEKAEHFLQRYDHEKKENLDDLLEKYSDKFHQLFYRLLKKYPEGLILRPPKEEEKEEAMNFDMENDIDVEDKEIENRVDVDQLSEDKKDEL